MKQRLAIFAIFSALFTSFATSAAQADEIIVTGPHGVPVYEQWQPGWDRFEFDRRHVVLGTVVKFEPYRLQVARRNGDIQMIDLKNGTVILPTGTTPMLNERVAIVGYYSRGTFIANRILVRG